VSDEDLRPEPDVAHVNWKLNESLKACHAMVADYRLMLGSVANDNPSVEIDDRNGRDEQSSKTEEA
jgi:hypothetical protein